MTQTEMLHQMCHEVLAEADIKAICKSRGLPSQAASSRPMLETLFLAEAGVADLMRSLTLTEIALLHLLSSHSKPVNITFFSQLDPPRSDYGTFTQLYQHAFLKVKERLVRKGLLLLALEPAESHDKKTNMERWLLALPVQFARHLPPLLESAKRLSGVGDYRNDLVREKLKTELAQQPHRDTQDDRIEIFDGELCWNRERFTANAVRDWQKRRWQAETPAAKRRRASDTNTLTASEAAYRILATLGDDHWSDTDALLAPLEAFCGHRINADLVCEKGWRLGLLARQEAEGRLWYRIAPPPTDVPPERYLTVLEKGLAVDLNTVPLEALETLVLISNQRPAPEGQQLLLLTPELVKLGRAAETVAGPLADWIQQNAPAFQQAFEAVQKRRGKTILHENLSVARVTDLSLKVALEKALGKRIVPLSDEFLAFPSDAVAEVRRIVSQMGHVIKEMPS